MIQLALFALFAWIPCVIVLFVLLPARKAAATAVVGAWLLLPPIRLDIAGIPDYGKDTAAMVGIVLSTFLFGFHRMLSFRAAGSICLCSCFASPGLPHHFKTDLDCTTVSLTR